MEYEPKKPLHRAADVPAFREVVERAKDFSELLDLVTIELPCVGWDVDQLLRVASAASRLAKAAEAQALVKRSQSLVWERVQTSLERLKSSRGATLDYLEVKGWREWVVPQGLAGDQLERLANSLATLEEALESYEALRGTNPTTRTERHALIQRLQEREREIAQLVEALAYVVAPAHVLEEPPPPPEPAQTTSTAAARPRTDSTSASEHSAAEQEEPVPSAAQSTTPTLPPAAPAATAVAAPHGPAVEVAATDAQDGSTLATSVTPARSRIAHEDPDLDLFVGLLEREELPGAFWLAHVREHAEVLGLPPSWLVQAAYLASRMVRYDPDVAQAWYEAAQAHPAGWQEARRVCDPRVAGLFVAAAALEPAVVAPETGAVSWLQDLHRGIPDLLPPLSTILDVASRGQRVYPVTRDWHQALEEVRRQARHWIERTQQSSPPLRSAGQVLRYLASKDSEVGEVAWWIAGNKVEKTEAVRSRLGRFRDHLLSDQIIDGALARYRGMVRKRDLEGPFRSMVRNRIRRLADIADAWLEATEQGSYARRKSAVAALASRLTSGLDEMETTLAVLASNAEAVSDRLLQASAGVLSSAVRRLRAYLDGSTGRDAVHILPWLLELQRPLLALVPCPLGAPDQLPVPLPARYHTSLREILAHPLPPEEVFEQQLAAGDLLACHLCLEIMEVEAPESAVAAVGRFNAARSALSEEMSSRIDTMQARVEKETIDHVLPEGLRSEFLAKLQGIREHVLSLDPRFLRRAEVTQKLEEMERRLRESRQNRIRALEDRIQRMRQELSPGTDSPSDGAGTALRYLRLAAEALESGDIPLADEYVTLAEQPDSYELPGQQPTASRATYDDYVERFWRALPELEKQFDQVLLSVLVERLSRGEDISTISTSGLPSGTLAEVRAGLHAYMALKRVMDRKGAGLSECIDKLRDLIAYMGFTPPELSDGPPGPTGYVTYRATMDGGTSPLPEFGSDRGSRYYVVLVGGRPGMERMAQTIASMGLSRECPIIIYFGRLTRLQRAEWAEYCRKNRFTALLVDELMLFFVASERGVRLRPLVLLSLAWGYANPYTPFAAGAVPKELFKGRDHIVNRLLDPSESGVIYGGRQLGKSAILRAVAREVERRRMELGLQTYVCYLDIRALGSRDATLSRRPEALWSMIRNWLQSTRLIPAPPEDPVALRSRIVDRFNRDKALHLYLLLDEADNFLEADGAAGFPTLHELKALSDATGRRFKVVLSGLHSVQRYSLLPNQPLAHIGHAMVVGPLDPKAAIELVREPLFTLGFRFQDDTPLYRILCYTNYHPALIQHFCRELVDHLMARRPPGSPTHVITVKDVDQVYQRTEVRQVIRERFEWTIALDERYQALVYAITLDQLWEQDGYRKEYSASEAHALARDVWPAAFERLGTDEVRTLLDELIGLGVLVKSTTGRYRLRNGNVVRALGSPEEIWARVERFTDAGPPSPRYDPEETHEVLRRETGEFSPLTLQQEKAVNSPDSGVYLVMASEALGLSRIWEAIRRLEASPESEPHVQGYELRFERLPSDVVSADAIAHYLGALGRQTRRGRIVVYADVSMLHAGDGLANLVSQLTESVARVANRDRTVKLLLQMDPETVQRWYREPQVARERAEGAVLGSLVPPLFSERSLRRYLSNLGAMATPDVVGAVLRATGGWPWLIRRLVDMVSLRTRGLFDNVDPRQEATTILHQTDPASSGELVEPFLEALGLTALAEGIPILRAVHALAPVSPEELSPELVETSGPLTGMQLRAILAVLQALRVLVPGPQGVHVEPIAARALGLK